MLAIHKLLRKVSKEIAELPEEHIISGHKIVSRFVCNFGFMNRCSRHKVYINKKAIGWYEEGPSKSFLEPNWSVWILDSVYFKNEFKNENGEKHPCKMQEMPYSDPPLYCPILETPEEFLTVAKFYKLV